MITAPSFETTLARELNLDTQKRAIIDNAISVIWMTITKKVKGIRHELRIC